MDSPVSEVVLLNTSLLNPGLSMTDLWPVYRKYVIRENVAGQRELAGNDPARFYLPMAEPQLPYELAKVQEGDERAALAFAHRWGGLSSHLTPAGTDAVACGELHHLWWHAAIVRVVLELFEGLQRRDDERLRARLRTHLTVGDTREYDTAFPPDQVYPPDKEVTILGRPFFPDREWLQQMGWRHWLGQGASTTGILSDALGAPRTTAHAIIHFLIADVGAPTLTLRWNPAVPEAERAGPSFALVTSYRALLGAIYFHLMVLVSGQRNINRCEGCCTWFERTRSNQKYCGPRCKDRHNKRKQRKHKKEA